MTIRTKQELLDIFADAAPGRSTREDIRDFIASNQVGENQIANAPAVMAVESDAFVADVGCTSVEAPLTSEYGSRVCAIANASGGPLTVTAAIGDTIELGASVVVGDNHYLLMGARDIGSNWRVLVNTTPVPGEYALAMIQGSANVTDIVDGVFVDINETLTDGGASGDFSISGSSIEYIGSEPKLFSFDVSISAAKAAGSAAAYTYALVRDTTEIPPHASEQLGNLIFDIGGLAGIVSLSTNEVVKVQVRGEGTSDDIIVLDLSLRLLEI